MAPATPAAGSIPADRLELYDRLIATVPGLERKGAAMPYTSLNGHMFSYLGKDGRLALRLPTAERQTFVDRFSTTLHEAYGIVQKEYVTVPDDLLTDTATLAPYLAASYAYVSGLKPKPTTRKTARVIPGEALRNLEGDEA
jgi:hypothetical protein